LPDLDGSDSCGIGDFVAGDELSALSLKDFKQFEIQFQPDDACSG